MSLYTLYFFLPAAFCIFWVIVHTLTAFRTDSFKFFIYLFLCCALCLFSEACHAVLPGNDTINTFSTLSGQLAGPSIVPLLILYLQRQLGSRQKMPLHYLWIIVPVVLFTAGSLLYFMRGVQVADELYSFFTIKVYNTVLIINLIFFYLYTIYVLLSSRLPRGTFFRFYFKKGKVSLARMQLNIAFIPMIIMTVRVLFIENLYTLSKTIAVITASLLLITSFIFGLTAMFGCKRMIHLGDLKFILRFNYSDSNKAEAVEQMLNDLLSEAEEDTLRRIGNKIGTMVQTEQSGAEEDAPAARPISDSIFSAAPGSDDENSLNSRFKRLMMNEQLFLKPKLTLDEVAERLHSNKTYISKLVNNTWNLGFPELINILRVEYAEEFILTHREAKQEEIAQECGFLSASSFNTIFKKVTGMTPKVWISTMDRKNYGV